jgi:hypothetical protein
MAGTSWLRTPDEMWLLPARKQQRNGPTDIQNYRLNWELKATAAGTVFGQGQKGWTFDQFAVSVTATRPGNRWGENMLSLMAVGALLGVVAVGGDGEHVVALDADAMD